MGIAIFQIILGLIIIICFIAYILKNVKTNKSKQEKYNIIYTAYACNYLGGFPDIEGGKNINIIVFKDKINLTKTIGSDIYENVIKTIYFSDLINISIQSDTQIQSSISLGKMFVFGLYALAFPNNKTVVKNYLVIDCKYERQDISIILETNKNEDLVRIIKNIKYRED